MKIYNSFYVGILDEPENLNQYECNIDFPYKATKKYYIEGYKNVVDVTEVEVENDIEFIFMENIDKYRSVQITDEVLLFVFNKIMLEYLERKK